MARGIAGILSEQYDGIDKAGAGPGRIEIQTANADYGKGFTAEASLYGLHGLTGQTMLPIRQEAFPPRNSM